jgi:GT2 family glycosyltransferase
LTPALSVVIPNYQRGERLRDCLRSVQAAVAQANHEVEVIVVDDGSGDDSCAIVGSEFPAVALVALPVNRGYPTAVNAGIGASRGEWILTLNNDTTVDPDLFNSLLDVATSMPGIGLVAAQQRFASAPGVIYSAGMQIDARAHASDRLMGAPVSASETEPVNVFGACGAAALYRRSLLARLGGFDERFRFGLEDADLAWRAQMHGWCCLYAPGAIVYHDLGGTVPHGSDLRLFQAGRNRWLLIAKNLDTRQLMKHLPRILVFDLAYLGYACLRLRSLAPLRGRIAGLRLWRSARAAGAAGRRPVALSPATPLRDALSRRRAWRHAGAPAGANGEITPDWLDAT